jgi:hypothetical protein
MSRLSKNLCTHFRSTFVGAVPGIKVTDEIIYRLFTVIYKIRVARIARSV